MARCDNAEHVIPGSLLRVLGTGVLVTGESGTGKSELALGLLDRGHQMVADDAVVIRRTATGLLGSCPAALTGKLEIRGLGIMQLAPLLGEQRLAEALLQSTEIMLNIHLFRPPETAWTDWPRLEGAWDSLGLLGTALPRLTLPVAPGRPLPLLLEAVVRVFNANPANPMEAPHG